jgi:hypothetical protein
VNLDLPFPFSCDVTMRDGTGVGARMSGRLLVAVREVPEAEAPLALRWGPREASPEGWTHTRYHEGNHMLPVGVPGEDARVTCARAVVEGWDGVPAAGRPTGIHLPDADPFVLRVVRDDRAAREAGIRARSANLRIVGGRAYAPCPEPVAVETRPGVAEIRVGRGIDWIGVRPLSDLGAADGSPRVVQGHEVMLPSSLSFDRSAIAAKVVRKALIVLRKACEGDAVARRRAAEAEASLAGGQARRAAEAMALCLAAIAPAAAIHAGLREFVARTQDHLVGYLAPA